MKAFQALIMLMLAALPSACAMENNGNVPVYYYGQGKGAGSTGAHVAMMGDTVDSIAARYNVPRLDLIELNHLEPPYTLLLGQRLLLPAPRTYSVRPEDSVSSVARLFGTSPEELAQLNHLSPPFRLQIGQQLEIPSVSAANDSASMAYLTLEPPVPQVESASLEPLNTLPPTMDAQPQGATVTGQPLPQPTVPQAAPTQLGAPTPTAAPSALTPTAQPPAKVVDVSKIKVPARGGAKMIRPVQGNIASSYGPKADTLQNDGINIVAVRGTPVRAAENGVVIYAGEDLASYGRLTLVKHQDGLVTAYAHQDKFLVNKGQVVKRGQTIGTVGSSGNVKTPQLHFEVRKGSKPVNPMSYLE